MANYSLVINSKFKPFSYQELLAPALMSTQAHQQVEEAYANLASEAALAGNKANEQTDPIAYARYKAYSDELNAMADELAKNGLTPNSRKSMFDMRTRYANDIVPIETAYERRRTLADEQRKMQLTANGNLRFDNDFSTLSLDALLNNPEMGYNALNGENITARASALAANFARGIVSDPKYSSILNGQYWQAYQRAGYTPEQIIAEAANDPNAPAELRQIRESIHNQLQSNSAYDRDWVDSYISQGFTSGIGQAQYSTMGDQSYLNAAQRQAMEFSAEEHGWAEEDRALANTPIDIGKGADGKNRWIDPRRGMVFRNSEPDKNGKRHRIYEPGITATGNSNSANSSGSTSSKSGGKSGSLDYSKSKLSFRIDIQGSRNSDTGRTVYGTNSPHQEYWFESVEKAKEDENSLEDIVNREKLSYEELGPALQNRVSRIHGVGSGNTYDYMRVTTKDGGIHLYVVPRGTEKGTAERPAEGEDGYIVVGDNEV